MVVQTKKEPPLGDGGLVRAGGDDSSSLTKDSIGQAASSQQFGCGVMAGMVPEASALAEAPAQPAESKYPYTNRGTFVTNPGILHWLSVTVWVGFESLLRSVVAGLVDGFLADEYAETVIEGRKGLIRRSARIIPGLYVHEFGSDDEWAGYCSVSCSGDVCDRVGLDGLRFLYRSVGEWRHRATRIDPAFDGVPFGPADVEAAIQSGNFRSRFIKGSHLVPDAAGNLTCYAGKLRRMDDGRVGIDRKADRMLRVYDYRGPTRFELEVKGAWAESLGELLLGPGSDAVDAGSVLVGFVRDSVDFVDRSSDSCLTRCELLPWWAEFVGQAGKAGVRRAGREPVSVAGTSTAIGRVDGVLQRFSGLLGAAAAAYGADWLAERIAFHARRRGVDGDLVRDLMRWRGSGVANVPEREESHVPF